MKSRMSVITCCQLVLASIFMLAADSAFATTCATAWSAATVYTAGGQSSENSVNYQANWWTQGDDPATHNGGAGSGQPWTSLGACSGSGAGGGGGGLGAGGAIFVESVPGKGSTFSFTLPLR